MIVTRVANFISVPVRVSPALLLKVRKGSVEAKSWGRLLDEFLYCRTHCRLATSGCICFSPNRGIGRGTFFRRVDIRASYLIDVRFGVIADVEASRAVRQAEVGAARTMLERTEGRFGFKPQRLAADSAYGSARMLNWLVEDKQITPHIPVIDKSNREDGTFSRSEFRYNAERDA
jgi:hypothetical protein